MADVDLDKLEQATEAVANGSPFLAVGETHLHGLERWRNAEIAKAKLVSAAPDLIAELRRWRGMTCETCKHSYTSATYYRDLTCRKARRACAYLGNGCRAHEPKEASCD